MRRLGAAWTLLVTLWFFSVVKPVSAGSDEDAIRQLLNKWAQAFRAHDVNAIMAMYAPDVVAYDIAPPLQYIGADSYKRDYVEFLNGYDGPVETEMRDLRIVVDGNLAVAMCLERMSGTLKSGQKSDIWVRVTSCFRKVNGKWLDFHDHVSTPTDFATGKSLIDLKP